MLSRVLMSCCALGVLAPACAIGPSLELPITETERVQPDEEIGAGLARQFESKLDFKQDKEVLIYLHDLAAKLVEKNTALKFTSDGVLVISDHGALWRDYSIPGNRIYLSSSLLKRLSYENEIAAAIAFELSHILMRHLPQRMHEKHKSFQASNPADFPSIEGLVPTSSDGADKEVDFFSPTGVYAYTDENFLECVDGAVNLLYEAGFDPRGLVSLWELYRSELRHSPFEDELLGKLMDKTRTSIAQHSPLRNPIVRSQAFLAIQKRIQGL